MLEAVGDLWSYPADYRVVTTNGVVRESTGELIMGKGVALEARKRFPGLPAKLGRWVTLYGSRCFLCREEGLISFPTKYHWADLSSIQLIMESARQIVAIADKYDILSVAMPRPGCGNGGLTWDFVRRYLVDLDDRFTVLTPGSP